MMQSQRDRTWLAWRGMKVPPACVTALVLGAIGFGCGDAMPASSGPPTFPADALTAAASTSGQLHVELRTDPQPPVHGAIAGQLAITNAAGEPVDGLDLAVVPWMPSHGHGTSITPRITAQGQGLYLVEQLYLYMGGTWELRTTISGAVDDEVVPNVEVP